MDLSGPHPHEAFVPAGLHGPVSYSWVPSPNYPVVGVTHSGETVKAILFSISLDADLVPELLQRGRF